MSKKGMLLKGPSHDNGGIAGKIKETGQPIEVEGDEMIINKRSTRIKDHIVCKGTGEGIGSALNELGGGKKWSDKGNCTITKFKKGEMIPKLENAVVFDNGGETIDRYTILIKPTGEVLGASNNPFHGFGQHVGNVTDRMNITFGYGWRKGRDQKSINRITKDEVENYIYEAKKEGHLGKQVEDLNSLPEDVKKFIMQEQEEEKMASGSLISSRDASDYVARTAPFKGAGHILAENVKGSYVVYSYGYYPLLVFKNGQWYENKEKYSRTTSKQLSRSRPYGISPEYKTTSELNELIGETRTQSSHFYEEGCKIKKSEWLVVITDEEGYEHEWVGPAEDEDGALHSAEQDLGFESKSSSVIMLTDSEGNDIKYKKGKKISSHINKRKDDSLRNIQRMVIRDNKLKKAQEGMKISPDDKFIKINEPENFDIVMFIKSGSESYSSYMKGKKIFKSGDICIYIANDSLTTMLDNYGIHYTEFDNKAELDKWLESKLPARIKNKL